MCDHGCPKNPDLLAPLPPSLPVILVNDPKRKAFVDLRDQTPTVYVDDKYARSLDDDSMEALMWHESAHLQAESCARSCEGKPAGCERCADNRLGACMFLAGFDRFRAYRAVEGLNLTREGYIEDAMAGWDYAKASDVPSYRPLAGVNLVRAPLTPSTSSTSTVSGADPGLTASGDDGKLIAEDATAISDGSTQVVIDQIGKVSCDCCRYDCGWIAAVAGATMAGMVAVIVATVKA